MTLSLIITSLLVLLMFKITFLQTVILNIIGPLLLIAFAVGLFLLIGGLMGKPYELTNKSLKNKPK